MHTSLMSYNQNMIPSGDDRPVFPTIDLFANTSLEELQQSLCAAVANYRDFLTRKISPFQQSWVVRSPVRIRPRRSRLCAQSKAVSSRRVAAFRAVQPDRICQHDLPIYIYTSLNLLSQYVEGKTLLRCYRKFVLASSLPPYRTDIPAEELKKRTQQYLARRL
ncbi:RolB family protein [Rhizobium nepotum]|uniref:RolB family protein n=1 Tax=Rhizobium nepotum TaxID=1035271 RepID=UPI003CED0034